MRKELTADGYAKDAEFTQNIARNAVTYCVSVSKVGGGTVGRSYDGDWEVTARTTRGRAIYDGHRLRTGTPKTHKQVARMVVDIATADGY